MIRFLPTFMAVVLDLMVAPARSAAPETPDSIQGSYKAVTESEWDLALELKKQGKATYTISSWEAGKAATTTSKTQLQARWEVKDGVLTMTFPGSTPKVVSYEISSCLSYKSFGGSKCSPGLRPLSNDMGRQYSQPLWNATTFKFP